jgi:hypothetical protein
MNKQKYCLTSKGPDYFEISENDPEKDYIKACFQGGGWLYNIPRKDIIKYVDRLPSKIRKSYVEIDDSYEKPFKCFLFSNNRWNGWMIPYMEKSEIIRLIKENVDSDYYKFYFNQKDELIFEDLQYKEDYPDEKPENYTDVISPIDINYDNKIYQVWNCGFSWIWSETEIN